MFQSAQLFCHQLYSSEFIQSLHPLMQKGDSTSMITKYRILNIILIFNSSTRSIKIQFVHFRPDIIGVLLFWSTLLQTRFFSKFIPHQNFGSTGIDLESIELDNFIFTESSSSVLWQHETCKRLRTIIISVTLELVPSSLTSQL